MYGEGDWNDHVGKEASDYGSVHGGYWYVIRNEGVIDPWVCIVVLWPYNKLVLTRGAI